MSKKIILILLTLISTITKAQSETAKSLNISLGIASTYPYYDDVNISGRGFTFQSEYVISPKKWIDIRPYAGLIFTKTDSETKDLNYKSSCNAFVLGGKIRFIAPIPYVAPYLESGIGISIGNFDTINTFTNIDKNGIITNIPVSFGLELGRKRKFDFGFSYYFHPSAEQFTGSALLGFKFPLN